MRLKSTLSVAVAMVMSLCVLHLASCCNVAESKFALGNNSTVVPMNVKVGTTAHYLTDYYPQWVGA
ncbi:MAG: hypothetical protein IKT66_07125, partial [Alistipes sp.]|nr:hypothetical protein [Alistipes sp.]